MTQSKDLKTWDLFCHVVDNYGDVGVCWRLAKQLAEREYRVRLFIDDASALAWMAPDYASTQRIEVLDWADASAVSQVADVVVETFGCQLPEGFIAAMQQAAATSGKAPIWLNLEYLSAEDYVERSHGLASPQQNGLQKWFFYPGYSPRNGGLLRETDLGERRSSFDTDAKTACLTRWGVNWQGQRLISLFCYEAKPLAQMLAFFDDGNTLALATHGRSQAAIKHLLQQDADLAQRFEKLVVFLPALTQTDFDHLLWASDINFVRGEDSLLRALWAAKPMVWQPYPQHDLAHHAKLEAFLSRIHADAASLAWHRWWNGLSDALPQCQPSRLDTHSLLQQADLCSQITAFALGKRLKQAKIRGFTKNQLNI